MEVRDFQPSCRDAVGKGILERSVQYGTVDILLRVGLGKCCMGFWIAVSPPEAGMQKTRLWLHIVNLPTGPNQSSKPSED